MQALTLLSFVDKSIKVHGLKYDYSNAVYINNTTKVEIICQEHGPFLQKAVAHLSGQGCPTCGRNNVILKKKLTQEQFIEKAIQKHGNKYDYSLTEYNCYHGSLKILCPKHGEFIQRAGNHLNGNGCPKCSFEGMARKLDDFISESTKVHNGKYAYEMVVYKNNKSKIKIICPKHGIFLQDPISHSTGSGCPKCAMTFPLTKLDFVTKSNLIHLNKYNYSLLDYKNHSTKVIIICSKHGQFTQTPNRHLKGDGCPKCNSSKGETRIRKYLEDHRFTYKEQVKFDTCKNKRKLPFDFVVEFEGKNLIIEYYGEQHYSLVNFSSNKTKAIKKFEQVKCHDNIKNEWCQENDVPLYIIPYWDFDRIELLLNRYLTSALNV